MQGFWGSGLIAWIPSLVIILMFVWFYSTFLSTGRNYADQVRISDSKMVFGTHDGNITVSVIGILQNDVDFPLEDFQLEAQFFDKDGELLDVGTHNGYSETIPASGEAAFKVYVYAARPKEDYESFKVFVRSAEAARSFP